MKTNDGARVAGIDSSMSLHRVDVSHRRIMQLAWPIILGNISVPLLGLVDTAILGRLANASSLAAVAIASQLFTLVLWTVGFLRMGTTARTALLYGQNKYDQTVQLLLDAAVLIVPIGLLLAIFVSSATPWAISHFGNDLEVHQQAMEYLAVRWWSMPAILGQYVVLGWAIGRGATWVPFVMLVTANTLNAVLDIWFVLWLDLGVSGLAMGSIIADYVSLFIGLWAVSRIIKKQPNLGADRSTGHFDGFVHPVKRTLSRQNHSLTQAWWVRIQPLLVTNSHLLIRTLILLLVFLFFTYQGAESSSTVVAANAVLLSLLLLISNGLDGFAHAAETLIGQCSGKILGCVENAPPANTHLANHGHTGNRAIKYHYQDRWSAVLRTGLQTGLTAFAMSLVFLFLGDILLSWLNQQETVLALLNHLMPFLVLLPLIGAGGYWVDGILLGAQKTRVMRNIMLMTTLGIFIPGWYVLTQWLFLGNEGLWGALFVFLLARFIFAIPIIKRLKQG